MPADGSKVTNEIWRQKRAPVIQLSSSKKQGNLSNSDLLPQAPGYLFFSQSEIVVFDPRVFRSDQCLL